MGCSPKKRGRQAGLQEACAFSAAGIVLNTRISVVGLFGSPLPSQLSLVPKVQGQDPLLVQEREVRVVLLSTWGFCVQGDTWQHLQPGLVVTSGVRVGPTSSGGVQRCSQRPAEDKAPAPQRVSRPQWQEARVEKQQLEDHRLSPVSLREGRAVNPGRGGDTPMFRELECVSLRLNQVREGGGILRYLIRKVFK